MVATSQPLAAQAGLQMIARGGNAADAAIASAITLTLVEPTGCGIGSDAFAILWDGQQLNGLNASGRAPARFDPKKYQGMEELPFVAGIPSLCRGSCQAGWQFLKNSENFHLQTCLNQRYDMRNRAFPSRL